MRQKPWAIIFLAILHILAPFGNSLFNAFRFHIGVFELWNYMFHQLNPVLNLSYVVLPILAGVFIFICKRWSFYAYLASLVGILLISFYGFMTSMNLQTFIYFVVFFLLDVLMVSYFMVPAVKQIYLDPRLRWWEASPRYTFNHEFEIEKYGLATISNISEGGLFLKTEAFLPDNMDLPLEWKWHDISYKVVGRIVHHQTMGAHGYGVQFAHNADSKKQMKSLMKLLKAENRLIINRSREPEQTFIEWILILFKEGKGFFPERRSR